MVAGGVQQSPPRVEARPPAVRSNHFAAGGNCVAGLNGAPTAGASVRAVASKEMRFPLSLGAGLEAKPRWGPPFLVFFLSAMQHQMAVPEP
jgi:hypothetical protein